MIFISGGDTILEGFPKVINHSSHVPESHSREIEKISSVFIAQELGERCITALAVHATLTTREVPTW